MRIEPGTLCLVKSHRDVPPELWGTQATFKRYGRTPLGGLLFAKLATADCTAELPAGKPGPSAPDADGWDFMSEALMPLGGWDAEQELALDVQNELAVLS